MLGWDDAILKTLACHGRTVHIARYVLINSPEWVYLGNRVRIDPFTVITTKLVTGDNVHILPHVVIAGGIDSTVTMGDWTFIGYGSKLFCGSEDYSGEHGPVIDYWGHNKVYRGDINFRNYSGIASDVMVMPGVTLPEGCLIGARSFVYSDRDLEPWSIYWGTPLRKMRERDRDGVLRAVADPAFLKHV